MSSGIHPLMLLVPAGCVVPPVGAGAKLRWTSVPGEPGADVWSVHSAHATDAELDRWHRAVAEGQDAPMVTVERALPDQRHVLLADHILLRLSLPTSTRRAVRAAPEGWSTAQAVVGALNTTFAWSTSEDALDALWAGGRCPWTQVWSTMIFHGAFLERLDLEPRDLTDIAGGGDVFRLHFSGSHWLLGAPEGLGNESAALLDALQVDNALAFALERVSVGHTGAVQRWLRGGRADEGG